MRESELSAKVAQELHRLTGRIMLAVRLSVQESRSPRTPTPTEKFPKKELIKKEDHKFLRSIE